ncbi:MAG: aldo/keto reductase [Moorea sp. SIOASIH]|nr:aldo/keto reductase [Moorena sp. SIOASIH]
MNRLALGTVQFGIPYGVANSRGQVSIETATEILKYAWSEGVNTLDTAIAYGDSEQRLGNIGVESWQVISKLPKIPSGTNDILNWVKQGVYASLERLKISQLYGLLLHCPQQLLNPEGDMLYIALNWLKENNLVCKIGISIYDPNELEELFSRFQFDLIQSPFNVLDRRLEKSGWLSRLKEIGIEVHVRSVFLQGLLLMNTSARPGYFNPWQQLWEQWEEWLAENNLTPLQACLGSVLSNSEIDRIVVGVDSVSHLQEICTVLKNSLSVSPEDLYSDDINLINPSIWKI